MTPAEWDRLPVFLSRKTVLRITGWSKRAYYAAVKAHPDMLSIPSRRKHALIRKSTLITHHNIT